MLNDGQSGITDSFGAENATRLAAAYDTAVSIISLGDRYFVPTREARRAMLDAMLRDAQRYGFSEDRLALVAIAAAKGSEPELGSEPLSAFG